ncbi:MAG: class I SAM-dependent methyltransferase [Candidatus Gottesmanbacteria bacterium]|nr:class I SAM-dependent methyltransferase [Candidatus Gottesmanbacteria bacterium]
MINKMRGVTDYSGLAKFYFRHLLSQLIKVGALERQGITILDFGCGKGELKRILPNANVIGYDVIPALTDVKDWRGIDFDVLVANEVFYSFAEDQLAALLAELRKKNGKLELVVGISRQSIVNNIGKFLLGRPDAHSATKIGPQKELEILLKYCEIKRKKNVLFLADVFVLTFKA